MEIYIDSFFLINFVFDSIVILVSGRLMGARIIAGRILSAAVIGALFSCVALFIPFAESLLLKIAVTMLLSFVAFSFGTIKKFLRQTVILFVGFFICAGASDALIFYGAGKKSEIMLCGVLSGLILSCVAVFFVSEKIKEQRYRSFAEIEILKNGKKYHLTALFDTGNTSRDILSGLPVIMAENIFPDIKKREEVFSTASGHGVMGVFIPDGIRVSADGEIFEGKDVAVGVVERRLSSDGSFNALIGGNCFERLTGKNKKLYKRAGYRRRGFLHRDGTAASAALKH